jgi:RNA polymerase sigma-70 factor (ECF subfamily)
MGLLMDNDSTDTQGLIERARAGDRQALNDIFTRYRGRLRRMVEVRLDWRLQARLDASDVIQDSFLLVATRLEEYLRDPKLPLFLWLRLVVGERLAQLHRHHLGTHMRDAGREVSLYREAMPVAELTRAETAAVLGIEESAAAKRYVRALKRLKDVLAATGGGLEGL